LCPNQHFISECGWSQDQYAGIKNYYWFSAKIEARLPNGLEIGNAYLGACCYKNLKDIMQDSLSDVLSGYGPQLVEEAKDEAEAWLSANNLKIESTY
jgi:hypothetical protein